MVTTSTARLIARDWHGGEGTALYNFWRTGRVDRTMLSIEASDAIKYAGSKQKGRLQLLVDYIRAS